MSRKNTEFVVVSLVALNLAFLVACDSGSGTPVTPGTSVTPSETETDDVANLSADGMCDHWGDSVWIQPYRYRCEMCCNVIGYNYSLGSNCDLNWVNSANNKIKDSDLYCFETVKRSGPYSSSSAQNSSSSSQFIPIIDYGSMTDSRDGKTYKTVKIGEQTWMAENLNYQDSRLSNDTSIAGTLYTWAEAVDSAGLFSSSALECRAGLCTMPDRVRGICPEGWHIPSDAEWSEMLSFVSGGKFDRSKSTLVSDEIFKVLRSTSGWGNIGNGTDLYGFSIRPTNTANPNRYLTGFWLPKNFECDIGRNCRGYLFVVIKEPGDGSGLHDGALFTAEILYSAYDYSTTQSVRCLKDTSDFSSSVVPQLLSSSSSTSGTMGAMTDSLDVFSSSSPNLIVSSSSVYEVPKQSIKVSACGGSCSCSNDECVECVKKRTTVCPVGMSYDNDLRRSIIQEPCGCW